MTLEAAVIQKLKAQKIILCTIESCTGGLIAHLLTNVPGASEVFWGSWVTYDNSSKINLGVLEKTISFNGAVSQEVAIELALHGLRALEAALSQSPSSSLIKSKNLIALSTTGIAGPGGGSLKKPVGLCYSSIVSIKSPPQTISIQAPANLDRIQTKTHFSQRALELVLNYETG